MKKQYKVLHNVDTYSIWEIYETDEGRTQERCEKWKRPIIFIQSYNGDKSDNMSEDIEALQKQWHQVSIEYVENVY